VKMRSLAVLLVAGLVVAPALGRDGPSGRAVKRIAIITNFWGPRSHANVLATKFFTGFPIDTALEKPRVKVASIYIDQPSDDDVGHKLAKKFNVPIYPTIREALTLGGEKLSVDAVLYVGEHGNYPRSRLGVKMYPRLNHMEQIFRVFDASGRSVPVYCDKHLAYSWMDAKWIYDRARELNVPLMAGSVLALTWRKPMLQHPIGARITEAVSVGYGALDSYGFHSLEVLQCMLERRAGGETGVRSVRTLKGAEVYEAAQRGEFSMELAEAACATAKRKRGASMEKTEKKPTAVIINYRDGTKGVMILLSGRYVGEHWGYAAKVNGETVACEFVRPPRPVYAYFSYLGLNVEKMFVTGEPQYPVERTLLTSGVLDMAVRSLASRGQVVQTPFLNIHYDPFDFEPIWPRSSEPRGASLGPWPPGGFEFIISHRRRGGAQTRTEL